ncbi:hypothetical protein [Saccharothrix hoggarensis]|uniref:Uncharacterized protein n=1 Tax=Saccharothrix hoggarensis TaxID=913853 RepID=A0ABW3QNN6_9PSEU
MTEHHSTAPRTSRRHRGAFLAAATFAAIAALPTASAIPAQAAIDGYIDNSYGTVTFNSYGERLGVCDKRADAHSVTAKLYNDNWTLRASVKDIDGAEMGCHGVNLDIAEGTPLWLTQCVSDGLGCTPPQRVEA